MIDFPTLNLISKFVNRTPLAADLSHATHGESQTQANISIGNFDYDDGSLASDIEDQDPGSILGPSQKVWGA